MAERPIQFERRVPPGDDLPRDVCAHCDYVAYRNPKIIVGSVARWEDKVLLCRRAIEPRRGFWTLPAGYLELGESPEEGAQREAWEEARAKMALRGLLAVYTVKRISQVQLMYRAELTTPDVSAGPESQEVALFSWDALPPDDQIAFPTVLWALAHDRQAEAHEGIWTPAVNPE